MVAVVGLGLVQLALPVEERANFWYTAIMGAKLLAFVGALAAAFAFGPGDYLRRAWLFIAANYACITFNTIIFGGQGRGTLFGWHPHLVTLSPELASQLNISALILGNVLAVVGAVLLARAWSVAGLDRSGSSATRIAVILCAIAIAAALTGYPIFESIRELSHGATLRRMVGLVISGSDALCFALVAPVLLTALALRGGVLWWPWVLYTASGLSWMVFDAMLSSGSRAATIVLLSNGIRMLACLLSFGAGIAQRWAVSNR